VERLFNGSLSIIPAPTREFWLATVDLASGRVESARKRFCQLLPAADPPMRLAIERRLSRLSISSGCSDSSFQKIIEDAAVEQHHDEQFGSYRSFFSKAARGTQLILALNVLIFLLELYFGGSSNPETLYRLGALFAPAVRAGEWWRLVASLFLHLGPLHLVMNMFALVFLGPFVEFAFGIRRFLSIYLLAGIGSMGFVMLLSGRTGDQLTVGASGCIMGLIGATAALMLRGWRQQKATFAKKRLAAIFVIVIIQTVFDALVPQISMAAHLSGTIIGFVAAMGLRDRLKTVATTGQANN
jgi:rhomboid protease GluP